MSEIPPSYAVRRRPWLWPAIIVAAVAVVALGAWLIWRPSSDDAAKAQGSDAAKAGKGAGKSGKGAGKA
ncbi:MAG TPA: hypothetical protein VF309_07235, partial [Usitatibacter sp.]